MKVGLVEADRVVPSLFSQPWPKEVWPVPPLLTAMVSPLQVPAVTVPKVTRLVEPAQVDKAVFSTLFKAKVVLRLAVEVPAKVAAPEA